MLSKLFENIRFGNELWFMLLGSGFAALHYFLTDPSEVPQIDPFAAPPILVYASASIAFLLFIIFLNRIFSRSFLVFNRYYYAPMVMLAILGFQGLLFDIQTVIFIYLTLLSLMNFYQISEKAASQVVPYLMNMGLISFAAFLIFPSGILFIILCWIHASIQGVSGWRKFAVPLYVFMFCLIVYYLLAITFEFQEIFDQHLQSLMPNSMSFEGIKANSFFMVIVILLFLFGLKEFGVALSKAPVAKRKIMAQMVWMYVLSLVFILLFDFDPGSVMLLLISLVILFANYFQYLSKNWMKEVWIWSLLILTILPKVFEI